MTSIYSKAEAISQFADTLVESLRPLLGLSARLYIGKIFFSAGLTKIDDWDTTLFLFEEEYQVPFINFELAAYLGTFGELLFPVLLFAGLFTRFSAMGLFIVNIVAVISLVEIAPAALYLHVIWGLILIHLMAYGGGFLSLDKYTKQLFKPSPSSQTHATMQTPRS